MSRQDANAQFALTSFLYGGNAAYIEDLHARYVADPTSVDAQWQAFFQSLKDDLRAVTQGARGASWQPPNLPHADGELIAALTGDWSEVESKITGKIAAKAQVRGFELSAAGVQQATRDFHPRVDADPRLSHPRSLSRQSRSARARAHEGRRGA